jgi:hypothetical protein
VRRGGTRDCEDEKSREVPIGLALSHGACIHAERTLGCIRLYWVPTKGANSMHLDAGGCAGGGGWLCYTAYVNTLKRGQVVHTLG